MRQRSRWEDNIQVDLRDAGCYAGDWIDIASYRVPMSDLCMDGNELPGSLKAS